MAFNVFSLCSTSTLLFVLHVSVCLSFVESNGFSVDLIHRDSPLSPLHNSSATRFDRLKDAVRRSHSRVRRIQAQVESSSGEYLMSFAIGTPPVERLGIADTGSDLSWIQCKPCTTCFNQTAPLFDLKASSTYKTLKCYSKQCKAMGPPHTPCTKKHNKCRYHVSYGDSSFSNGHLATETFTFGGKTAIQNVAFGCGHNNGGIFSEADTGIIGLGGGELSLISQLSETIKGRFSYCLVPVSENSSVTGTINFGDKALVSGSNVVSTMLFSGLMDTFYFVKLENVVVGKKIFELKTNMSSEVGSYPGNIIIDSGTTLTYLPRGEFYDGLVSAVKEAIGEETTPDPNGDFYLCYQNKTNLNVPYIALQFTGAKLELPKSSTFVEVDQSLVCFTIVPSSSYLSIFGNLLQENFWISYDLPKKKVSFMPTDCRQK